VSSLPVHASVVVDDSSPLRFGRHPIGQSVSLCRTFTNIGDGPIDFSIQHGNRGLLVEPASGRLLPNANVVVTFRFSPEIEDMQQSPIVFRPHVTAPIVIPVLGGGGFSRLHLPQGTSIDLGKCMILKETAFPIPVQNRGTATMHIENIVLEHVGKEDDPDFLKGASWPHGKVLVAPGTAITIPLIFKPTYEEHFHAKIRIFCDSTTAEVGSKWAWRGFVLSILAAC
jgi:hypothetical protein